MRDGDFPLEGGQTRRTDFPAPEMGGNASEAVHLRLGLEPGQHPAWGSNSCGWDLIQPKPHGLPTEITDLVSGPTETPVLGVSPQRGFSERQSDN